MNHSSPTSTKDSLKSCTLCPVDSMRDITTTDDSQSISEYSDSLTKTLILKALLANRILPSNYSPFMGLSIRLFKALILLPPLPYPPHRRRESVNKQIFLFHTFFYPLKPFTRTFAFHLFSCETKQC